MPIPSEDKPSVHQDTISSEKIWLPISFDTTEKIWPPFSLDTTEKMWPPLVKK